VKRALVCGAGGFNKSRERHDTLRDALVSAVRAPLERLRGNSQLATRLRTPFGRSRKSPSRCGGEEKVIYVVALRFEPSIR
jgi:hypothetical protein